MKSTSVPQCTSAVSSAYFQLQSHLHQHTTSPHAEQGTYQGSKITGQTWPDSQCSGKTWWKWQHFSSRKSVPGLTCISSSANWRLFHGHILLCLAGKIHTSRIFLSVELSDLNIDHGLFNVWKHRWFRVPVNWSTSSLPVCKMENEQMKYLKQFLYFIQTCHDG